MRIGLLSSFILVSILWLNNPSVAAEPGELVGITQAHNTVRTNVNQGRKPTDGLEQSFGSVDVVQPVPATPLEPMTWDDTLAAAAQAFANRCIWGHDSQRGRGVGENIFGSADHRRLALPESIVAYWAAEADDYDLGNNSCGEGKACGHYTQLVWHSSLKIGCGAALCPNGLTDYSKGRQIWVCRYSPAGNMGGERPYTAKPATPQVAARKGCLVTHSTWKDMVEVPASWSQDDCQRLQRQIDGTGHQLACLHKDSVGLGPTAGGPPTPDCGWASPSPSIAPVRMACNVVNPGHWRNTVPVSAGWTPQDCADLITTVGATQYQLGCITDHEMKLGTPGGGLPDPNCGWATPRAQKACSVYRPNVWRDITTVPTTWTKQNCAQHRDQLGATTYQLACITNNSVTFGNNNGGLPNPNCGWTD